MPPIINPLLMPSTISKERGSPCNYCGTPVLHPNQQCCLNCKNHPFDDLETTSLTTLKSSGGPTPPISPTVPAIGATGNPLVFEIRNAIDGSITQISASDLKDSALEKYYSAGLLFEISRPHTRHHSTDHDQNQICNPGPSTIVANHAIGLKIHGNAFGKTCLKEGNAYIVDRSDENMADSIIVYEDDTVPFWCRCEYSISEDSVRYSKVTIKADSKAWYNESEGRPAAWLFHERTLFAINEVAGDQEYESESEFDFANEIANDQLRGVIFNELTEAEYLGADDRYDDRVLVDCEGVEFSIKRQNLVIEIEINENAYAQKLRANYSDQEQFWFQFGDKVWVERVDEFDEERVIVRFDEEKYSIAKELVGL